MREESDYFYGNELDKEQNAVINAAYKRVRIKDPQEEKTEK